MSAFTDVVRSASRRLLWLDAAEYSARLLLRGAAPWLDATGYVAWQRKSHALLKSDVVTVPLAQLCEAWGAHAAQLRLAMRTRRRAAYPLQMLLADATLREHLSNLVHALRASFVDRVLALTLPTPRTWLGTAHALAHEEAGPPTIDDDAVDTAGMHVADFLRTFAGSGVEAVLIEPPAGALAGLDAAACEPLINLAKHYRWDVGVRAGAAQFGDAGDDMAGQMLGSIDFAITPAPLPALAHGCEIDQRFWSGAALPPLPDGSFLFAQIPADAAPERVLERLAVLRAA